MKRLSEVVAGKVEELAVNTARGTVGKSIPGWIHEVEIPAELKQVDLENVEL